MPRRVEVIVLCEDALHRSFATAFLKSSHISLRVPANIDLAGSRSNALKKAPGWIQAVRSRGGEAHLIVLVDLDNANLSYIRKEISALLKIEGLDDLCDEDNVLIVGAKREIDTWVTFLREMSVDVDEIEKYPVEDSQGRAAGETLARLCASNAPLLNAPPSLGAACRDWLAYRRAKSI